MIQSFAGRDAQAFFGRTRVRRLPPDIHRRAHRKLLTLHATTALEDTNVPPGNRLPPLEGDRAGQHAIWIDDQWRTCFRWHDGNAYDVEIVDDHG